MGEASRPKLGNRGLGMEGSQRRFESPFIMLFIFKESFELPMRGASLAKITDSGEESPTDEEELSRPLNAPFAKTEFAESSSQSQLMMDSAPDEPQPRPPAPVPFEKRRRSISAENQSPRFVFFFFLFWRFFLFFKCKEF